MKCDDTLLACVGGRPDEYELGQDMCRRPKHTHAHSNPRKVIRNLFLNRFTGMYWVIASEKRINGIIAV